VEDSTQESNRGSYKGDIAGFRILEGIKEVIER
jgi:hypothetical protein